MSSPKTLADLYAKKKAKKDTEELLATQNRGALLKSVASKSATFGAVPLVLSGAGVVAGAPALHRRLAEDPQIVNIWKKQGKSLPPTKEGLDLALRMTSDEAREGLRLWAKANKFDPGPLRKVHATEILGELGSRVGKLSLPTAAMAAILGGAIGVGQHYRKSREARELLRDAGLSKDSAKQKVASASQLGGNPYDLRGRLIAQAFFSEFEKIAQDGMGIAPQAGMLAGGVQNEAAAPQQTEVVRNESMPSHGVVASRIQQLDPRRAVGIPVMQPPPGYVYNPELASFVPNEQDPGWVAQSQVIEAARNKGWYDQGQQDVVTSQAQQQIDQQAGQGIQQAVMQDQAMQQQAALQQQAQMQATLAAAREKGRVSARMSLGQEPAGDRRVPREQVAGKKGKGVVIQVGR